MGVTAEKYGQTQDGQEITLYTIEKDGLTAKVSNYGAALVALLVPDKEGKAEDVALGFAKAEGYFANGSCLGVVVGPSANRTAKGHFVLEGKEYQLPVNDGPNNLHTDAEHGLHKKLWNAEVGEDAVTFKTELPDGECGLPGNRAISVTYSLTQQHGLLLQYHGEADVRTLFNPTNHSYFNLAGHNAGSILEHELQLFCSHYTPVVAGAIPTGEIAPVGSTVFDFRLAKTIGRDIDAQEEQLKLVGGYDHNFCVDGYENDGIMRPVAKAAEKNSGRVMEVYTTLPGVQFYAGNFLQEEGGKDGAVYGARDGFALETQFYPDSANEPGFPQPFYGGTTAYDAATEYRFSVMK